MNSSSSSTELQNMYPVLSDDLLYTLLQHGDATCSRVLALTEVILGYPTYAEEVCISLQRWIKEEYLQLQLKGSGVDERQRLRFLWYLLDALLKHAYDLYMPLIRPFLLEFATQYLPWSLGTTAAAASTSSSSSPCWPEQLVHSWADVLSQQQYQELYRHLLQAQLLRAEPTGEEAGDGEEAAVKAGRGKASESEVLQLQEGWDALLCTAKAVVAEGEVEHLREEMDSAVREAVLRSSAPLAAATPQEVTKRSREDVSSDEESDEEYAPQYVEGAQPRVLPHVDVPRLRRRRDARRRELEEV